LAMNRNKKFYIQKQKQIRFMRGAKKKKRKKGFFWMGKKKQHAGRGKGG